MFSPKMYELGSRRLCIRELFEYGLKQAAIVGKENVYDFSIGNPSVPAPEKVKEKLIEIINTLDSKSIHGYTSAPGNMEAREAVGKELGKRYGMDISGKNIFLTCGAAPAIVTVVRALNLGQSEFIVLAPYFPEYKNFVENNGGKLVVTPADMKDFQIPIEELKKRINFNTQAVIVNSPNNPSGAIYSRETLEKLAALLEKRAREYGHAIYIIADEPYREIAFDGVDVPFIPTIYKNTIVCYSYSKSLSLPGERIGYVCVPDSVENSAAMFSAVAGAARSIGHICAPSLLQLTIARCTELRPDNDAYKKNRDTLYNALISYGYECVKPQGAFYMFVKAPYGDAQSFSDIAKKRNLLLVPAGDFGCPQHLRISTCVAHDMIERSLPVFKQLIEEKPQK